MVPHSKVRLEHKSVFELGLPQRSSIDDLCASKSGIHLMDPEEFPAPSPVIAVEPSAPGANRFISPPLAYTSGPFFLAKLRDPLYLQYCNLVATPDGGILRESHPTWNPAFDRWPFTYLPGVENTPDGYVYSKDPAFDVPEDVVIVGHCSAGVFGHFLLDAVSAAVLLRRQIVRHGLKVALFSPHPWMLGLLHAAGIPAGSIIALNDRIVRFRSAIVTSALSAKTTYHAGSAVVQMFEALRQRARMRARMPAVKLFLRRGGDAARIANESDVADVFAEAGFLVLSPHKLSVPVQLALASQASAIAGSFGSGHALSGMMGTGATAIELVPSNKEDAWFLRVAARRGLEHRIIVTDGARRLVDTDWLRAHLNSMGF